MHIPEYEAYHEKKVHGDPAFPYTTYPCSIPLDFPCVPLHWHEEMELVYIKKGQGMVNVDLTPVQVSAGDLVIILPGHLHAIQSWKQETMEYENIIFQVSLLLSPHEDLCSHDFLDPLLLGTLSVPTCVTPALKHYRELVSCIDQADEICKTFPPAYPFAIKSCLFQFFYLLFAHHSRRASLPSAGTQRSLDKTKQTVKYIEEHYREKISVADIASFLNISASHFMKYFKKTMGSSFVAYLNDYRLTMASRLLVTSSDPILEVAQETGFDNLSYFNRLFKEKYKTTPSRYRRQARQTADRR